MARVQVRIGLGRGATLGALAQVIRDLSTTMDLGLRTDRSLAHRSAASEVERLWRDDPEDIVERAQGLDETAAAPLRYLLEMQMYLERLYQRGPEPTEIETEEWYRRQRWWYSRLRRHPEKGERYVIPPPPPWFAPWSLSLREVDPNLEARLVANEAGRRLPPVPVINSLTYRNPIELVILVAGAGVIAGIKHGTFVELLKLLRDWTPARAQTQAAAQRTAAEAREINALASQIELENEIRRRLANQVPGHPELSEAELSREELEALERLLRLETKVNVEDD